MKIRTPFSITAACALLTLVAALPLRAAREEDQVPVIGSKQQGTQSSLIGILYDFKQNQKREPVPMDRRTFELLVAQFIDAGWDEGMLNRFYRVSRPLYTTELQIPQMNADAAPKAFGVDKTVQPRMWMAWYKAQISPPKDGTYRFVGFADNYLAVAINSKTCLVACLSSSVIPCKWTPPEGGTTVHGNSGLWGRRDECIAGDWIEMKAGQVYDLDIIFGEVPGGESSCFLGIQRKGDPLPDSSRRGMKDPDPFQLAKSKFSLPGTLPWKAIQ